MKVSTTFVKILIDSNFCRAKKAKFWKGKGKGKLFDKESSRWPVYETSQLRKIVGQFRWLPSCATTAIPENEICAYHDESITLHLSGQSCIPKYSAKLFRNEIFLKRKKINWTLPAIENRTF